MRQEAEEEMRDHRTASDDARERAVGRSSRAARILAGALAATAIGLAGCTSSEGPGLLERQQEALHRFIEREYQYLASAGSPDVKNVHYVCTYRVSLQPRVLFLNPSIWRGKLDTKSKSPPGTFCTIVGFPCQGDTGVATLCELVVLNNGMTRTNVAILGWDDESAVWRKAMTNSDDAVGR